MIVLASRSPRRHDLLTRLEIPHEVDPVDVDETRRDGESPEPFVVRLAKEKALGGATRHPGCWVLGADTVVVFDGEILGKPASPAEAERMLRRLSGNRHEVVTAVALANGDTVFERCDTTAVWFRSLDAGTVARYVRTGEPLDKAGAYGVQAKGAVLVDRIEGDYFGVVGLPIRLVMDLLAQAGIPYSFTR